MRNANNSLSAREAAIIVLSAYRRKKAWSDLALNSVADRSGLSQLETALALQLVYGVLQNMALLDFYAAHYSNIELKRLEPRVLDILRISIYQIAFLTKIPHNAAVNEGVKLTKKFSNQRAAGYVNALLRKISKAMSEGTLPEVGGSLMYNLSTRYSHPEWLVSEINELLGESACEDLLTENNSDKTPVTVQVNTLLTDTETVLSALLEEEIDAKRHEWLDDCLELSGAGNITRLEVYSKGFIYIQDAAARLSVIAANPKKGDIVVDGCAAPGGKSFASAIMMENIGQIIAGDVHAAKLRHIENGCERMGISIIEGIEMDASDDSTCIQVFAKIGDNTKSGNFIGVADVVLADVPCSGFGIIRKKPEIRYKSRQEVSGLPEIQKKIITTMSKHVKPGGVLLYSTCTFLRSENEDIIEFFLKENDSFVTEGFVLPGIGEVPDGMLTLWPHVHGTDGFFICKLRRKNS